MRMGEYRAVAGRPRYGEAGKAAGISLVMVGFVLIIVGIFVLGLIFLGIICLISGFYLFTARKEQYLIVPNEGRMVTVRTSPESNLDSEAIPANEVSRYFSICPLCHAKDSVSLS